MRLQLALVEDPTRSYVSCDRWRDGDQITNSQPLGQWCKKVVQTKSVSKKCVTIEDVSIQVQADLVSYVPPLIPIPRQLQRNGQASETNAVSTSTKDDLLPSSVTVDAKLELERTRWLLQATKQYFFDRFLPDELNEIGLHKGMPG